MLPFRVNLHWLLAFVLSATFAVRLHAQREHTIVVWTVGLLIVRSCFST